MHLPQYSEEGVEDVVLFCQARGRLKKQKVAILTGDRVDLDEINLPERTAVIVQQRERKTFIDRPPLANIDQVIIVQAVRQPDFSPLWMDRYLVHFQLAVPFTRPIICLNKCDLEDHSGLLRLRSIYEPLGYFVIFVSAVTGVGLEELARVLHGKVSVFSGPSGVGKSSLLNKLSPGLDIKVGRMENSFGVGRHTTTYSELYKLNLENFVGVSAKTSGSVNSAALTLEDAQERQFSWVADTPGFNVMEFTHSQPREVAAQFPEIAELGLQCKFADCLHTVEADCAVLADLAKTLGHDEDEDDGEQQEDGEDEDEAVDEVDPGEEEGDDDGEASEAENVEPGIIVPSRYESYYLIVAEAQEMQQAAKSTSSKKEANFKLAGGNIQKDGKAKFIPKLHGRYRAAARNTAKQKVQNEDFEDVDGDPNIEVGADLKSEPEPYAEFESDT
ncbi:MAG: ribosome small subunit-dependent GTPase A [Cyanobacteria bacterium REEB67]|nr:ribosome small subunit-dependent GTPase A [Cyanobacteria bacterium REEB67]